MQPHQQRVVDEKDALDGNVERLITFTKGELFTKLPQEEQDRLMKQLSIMNEYSVILGERIAAFPPPSLTIVP